LASKKKKDFPSLSSVTLREYERAHPGNTKGGYNIGPLSVPKPLQELFNEDGIKLQICVRQRRERTYLSSENLSSKVYSIYITHFCFCRAASFEMAEMESTIDTVLTIKFDNLDLGLVNLVMHRPRTVVSGQINPVWDCPIVYKPSICRLLPN
jgi:hypothetical protein